MRIVDLLERSTRLEPGKTAVAVVDGPSLTYAQLHARVRALASGLAARGVGRGDRVAILAPSGLCHVDVYLAVAYLGAAAVPLNTHLVRPEVAWILGDAEPVVTIVDNSLLDRLPDDVEHVVLDGDGYAELLATPVAAGLDGRSDESDTAMIIYTSGTTGRPKGVCLSQRAIAFNGVTLALVQGFSPHEVMLSMTPLYHGATGFRVTTMLVDGQTHVILPRFDPDAFFDTVARHRVTTTIAVPTQLRRLLDSPSLATADLSSLRLLVYGAAPTALPTIEAALTSFDCDFYQGYGLTEATTNVTGLLPSDHRDPGPHRELLRSCGRATPGVDLRICDDEGRELPRGEVGEIQVKSEKVMTGYWRNPEATSAAVVDGWLRTGDLARMDERGYVFIVDRAKDMLISGGVNVYPSEIEAVLHTLPGVREAAVVGAPDDDWGEVPVAFLIPVEGAQLDPAAIASACREQLASLKVPRDLRIVDDFPRTALGKVRKVELAAELRRSWTT